MHLAPTFDELLPHSYDPIKQIIRARLINILNSQGEVLPSANSPRGKLWHLVNSPKTSLEECAEVIKLDSALATRIFKVANSGAYGAQAENILEAISHLGLRFVREQVFNASVFKQFSEWTVPPQWDMYWLRNIFVARSCERLASACGPTNGTEYLAGLIHDVGWLFLATHSAEEYGQIFLSGQSVDETELEILPFSHADIAAAMATRALLPTRAVAAIRDHHHPGKERKKDGLEPSKDSDFLSYVVYICDGLADNCQMDMFGRCVRTIESLQQGPEIQRLPFTGKVPDLRALAEEELRKSREIFDIFFSNRNFK